MKKLFLSLTFFLFSLSSFAVDMMQESTKAFFSYSKVKERSEYFTMKIKNATIGDDLDRLLLVAPLATGEVELNLKPFKLYYHSRSERGGLKFDYKF